jgi:hypothetical protein
MIELKCNEASDFEFDMQLNGGAVGAVPQVIFCLEVNPTMGMTFPCFKGDHGLFTVKLPNFCSVNVTPGEYPCRIMVLLGESVFFPYTDVLVLKDDPKPVVNAFARTNATVAPTVSVVQPTVVPQAEVECTMEAVAPVVKQEPAPAVPTPETTKPAEPMKAGPAASDVAFFSSLLKRKA